MLAIVTRGYDVYGQRVTYAVCIVESLTPNAAGHVERWELAVFDSPEPAFRCAASWQREIARGKSQRHAGIIARAEACSDGLFTDDDASAAIEAADLAAGGA